MSAINFESIRSKKAQIIKHDIPEWGGHVFIRKLSVSQCDQLSRVYDPDDNNWVDALVETIVLAVVDDEGEPIFSKDHYDFLRDQDGDVLKKIHAAALQFNGMDKSGDEAVKP